jgi:predicted Holliday junction resolvase-like endonuclease
MKQKKLLDYKKSKIEEEIAEKQKNQQEELDKINETIGARISYEEVRESFKETSDVVQSRFRQIIGTISEGCEVYADMTYGPKTLTPVLLSHVVS